MSQLTIGNAVVLVITVIGYPILSRLYTDVQFGQLAVFQSSVIILAQLSTLNFEEALVLIDDKSKFRSVIHSILTLSLLASILILILSVLSLFTPYVSNSHLVYIILIPITLWCRSIMQTGKYTFIKTKVFKKIAVLKVFDRVSFQFLATGLGWLRLPPNFLIISYAVANVLAAAYSFLNIRRYLNFGTSLKSKIDSLSEYTDFPKFALPSIFLDQLSRQLPVYLITYIVSTEVTGQFSIAYRVLSIPEMIIGASIGQVFYQRLSELYRDKKPIKAILMKLWLILFMLGVVPFGIVMLYGEHIFSFVFGAEWKMAGQIASYLAPMLLVMFVSTPSSFIFTVTRNQKRSLIINILVLVSRSTILYIGLMHLPILQAIFLYGLTEILLIIIYNVVAWKSIKTHPA